MLTEGTDTSSVKKMWCKKTLFLVLFLPYFVAPEESSVYKYTPENFERQIELMDGNFIMFYAPWFVLITVSLHSQTIPLLVYFYL